MAYNSKTGGDEMKEAAALPRGGRHKAPLRPLPAMDLPFLVLVLTLVGFGLVMLGSASGAVALYRRGDAFAYLRPQLFYAAMGIAGLWLASRVDYHIFHKIGLAAAGGSRWCCLWWCFLCRNTTLQTVAGAAGGGHPAAKRNRKICRGAGVFTHHLAEP